VIGPEDGVLGAHQVKLRGFRVELGEIENALSELPGVQLAVAVVVKDHTGLQRLVAYITPASVDPAAATADLKGRLPAHMVPDIIMPLERMPLLPSDKVNRKALPPPDWAQAVQQEYVAPASELEAQLQAIWHSVLGQDAISTQADFFSVGGNSLQARLRGRQTACVSALRCASCVSLEVLQALMLAAALQASMVMAKVRQSTGVDAPVALLFGKPTIASLAAAMSEHAPGKAAAAGTIPSAGFSAAALAGGVPCSPNQRYLLQRGNPRATGAETHLAEAVRLAGALDATALDAALAAVAARHGALRTRFLEQAPGAVVQAVLPPGEGPAALELHRANLPSAEDVHAALQSRVAAPFDLLGAAAPWRAVLYSNSSSAGSEHVLLLVAHQAVSDRWSLALLVTELAAAYVARRGDAARLPPAPRLQLADVAAWQAAQLASGAWAAEQEFWRQQLAYAPRLLELPTDRPRPSPGVLSMRAGAVAAASPAGLVLRLEDLAAGAGATLFMVVLAAWKVRRRPVGSVAEPQTRVPAT